VRNEVLHRVKEERNILHVITRRKANWIGYILRTKSSKTHYRKKGRRRNGCDGKTRNKT
jgi:hypothetical protein